MLAFDQEQEIDVYHGITIYHGITVYLVGLLTAIYCTYVQGILYNYMYNVHVQHIQYIQ